MQPVAPRGGQGAIDGALALIVVLLIVQMWLLTASLEAFLAGHDGPALPAALGSGALLLCCFALYRLIVGVDRQVRIERPGTRPSVQSIRRIDRSD